jgi:phospholipase C
MRMTKNGIMRVLACAAALSAAQAANAAPALKHVIVIAMENHDAGEIYGQPANAPYINNVLLRRYARAMNFNDELPIEVPSEPHYVWMEAGTNAFADHVFGNDYDPSSLNSTASTAHLVTQIRNSRSAGWMTYQEGLSWTTGSCPIVSSGFYAAKHNPFVFFRDVSGSPPSQANAYCAAHSKPYSAFAADLAAGRIASYVFITPDLCHDMHGAPECGFGNLIKAGDDWLKSELPGMIEWAERNSAVIFVTWDEGDATGKMPFLAIGQGVKANYAGKIAYDHGSITKSVERIFNLPVLPSVAGKNDLSDLFRPGLFP